MIDSKRLFEQAMLRSGHTVCHYQAGEGSAFISEEFQEALIKAGQDITYCVPGTHFQNGVVERGIQTRHKQGQRTCINYTPVQSVMSHVLNFYATFTP